MWLSYCLKEWPFMNLSPFIFDVMIILLWSKRGTLNVMCSPWSKSLYDLHWFELSFEGVGFLNSISPYIFVVMIILLWSRRGLLMWCVLLGQNLYMTYIDLNSPLKEWAFLTIQVLIYLLSWLYSCDQGKDT